MEVAVFIYGLKDPRTDKRRYVGQSVRPVLRHKDHVTKLYGNPTSPKTLWVKELKEFGLQPDLEILEVTNSKNGGFREMIWIEKSKGPELLNVSGHGAFERDFIEHYSIEVESGLITLEAGAGVYKTNPETLKTVFLNNGFVFFVEPGCDKLLVSNYQLNHYKTAIKVGIWKLEQADKL